MPRVMRSNLPTQKGREFLILTKEEKEAKRTAEWAAARAEKAAAKETPKFDPERLALQSYGPGGLCFIQQTHRFSPTGAYLGEVPPNEAYVTTEEMERNNARDKARWRAKTRNMGQLAKVVADQAVPDGVLEAGRENARAEAAERLAE